jgi:hypothetical protein
MACEEHPNANRIRHCTDVSFVNWEDSKSNDYLYEAQNSCLVSGADREHWVA